MLFHNGRPFGWERKLVEPKKICPGVVAVSVTSQGVLRAVGGNSDGGAKNWEVATLEFETDPETILVEVNNN